MSKQHSMRKLLILQVYMTAFVTTYASAAASNSSCEVRARTDAGWVCGVQRSYNNHSFASFLNVPYSRQPVGSLRFQELQPAEPWEGYYDATTEGPICPQYEVLYGSLMTNKNSSEACIHANVFVPIDALPASNCTDNSTSNNTDLLPIFVLIHGGGFSLGSGDSDVNGPEYLVTEKIIVITFNYRINSLGFLSINSTIPANNGLRDALTLLKWVKVNAKYFGGNPDDVTLAGQGSGSASVHLLSLSKASEGLFKRGIMMSGTAIRGFFTSSPTYADTLAQLLLTYLGINATDPEEIRQQLIALPIETLMNATYKIQATYGFIYFTPGIESYNENFTTIIDKDPEVLLRSGQGSNISLLIGFTNLEGKNFVPYYTENDILTSLNSNPLLIISPDLTYKLSTERALVVANETINKCFNGTPTVDKFVKCFTNNVIVYPAAKVSQIRASMNSSAPVYLYQFSYNASFSPIKVTKNITYDGATHTEDLMFYCRTNSMENQTGFEYPTARDSAMRKQMVQYVKNFISCDDPLCSTSNATTWPAETSQVPVQFENIVEPSNIYYTNATQEQADIFQYFNAIYNDVYNTTS